MFVEKWGAFFVDLAAGEQKGGAAGQGGVDVDFVAKFAGKSKERGWHGLKWCFRKRSIVDGSLKQEGCRCESRLYVNSMLR